MTSEKQERTVILNHLQIEQKITRIAHHILENNFQEKSLFVIGIQGEGSVLAEKLVSILKEISTIDVLSGTIGMDKKTPNKSEFEASFTAKDVRNKVIILVDDVLNSGRTMIHATNYLLDMNVKSIQAACLVDRKHHTFPIRADYVGLLLSTSLQEHISVQFGKQNMVYLD